MSSFSSNEIALLIIFRPSNRPLERYIVTVPSFTIPTGTLDGHLTIRLDSRKTEKELGMLPTADQLVDLGRLSGQRYDDKVFLWDLELPAVDIEIMKSRALETGAAIRLLDPQTFTEKAKKDNKSQAAWESYQYLRKKHRDVQPEVRRYRRSWGRWGRWGRKPGSLYQQIR